MPLAGDFAQPGILGVKQYTPTQEPRTTTPALFENPEQEGIQQLALFFEEQNRWARSRKPPRGPEDISPDNIKKARAFVAAFQRDRAKLKAKPAPSDAEPGLSRNPAFGYARFGGPYLKRA